MMFARVHHVTGIVLTLLAVSEEAPAGESLVSTTVVDDGFALVSSAGAAPVWYDANDHPVVPIAARDFADDVERVTKQKPSLHHDLAAPPAPIAGNVVIIGTLGRSGLIDALVRDGQLDASQLAGKWETFLITTVARPCEGIERALVITGSDRRGTAFGVYELSQQIGVSPWYWWADVPPKQAAELYVRAGAALIGPPSVKYRGIFINDEDWGLQPWAAQTFAPEEGGIGPKVYRKVFELLLRLKGNTLWPAMHACTKPFNAFPENARLADEYAIVMGSSHAEPMLRNNVGEWTGPHDQYNYISNRAGVLKYWEERVATNRDFENVYTVGMRGIHDSAIQGTKTDAERVRVLEQVFADQRAVLAKHVQPDVERVPQMFCAYKEVLELYRQGLNVPSDVTVVWPDDNFGYVRNFATPEEQRTHPGGFGVYYHISYLGRPLAYLWLCTTPPALIWEEMSKAYDHGARQIWIVNVGDIKPAEIGTEFFLQMAWDINRWNCETLPNFLEEWAAREFGAEHAAEIAEIMRDYYQLNFQRKPEHLQWWLPREEPRPSPFTRQEIKDRLAAFTRLEIRFLKLAERVADPYGSALMELVGYPVLGSALANGRYFASELGELSNGQDATLQLLTASFGTKLAQGKWAGFMRLEPADDDWRSMRIAPWQRPAWPPKLEDESVAGDVISVEAEHWTRKRDSASAAWAAIAGLGRTGSGSVAISPSTAPSVGDERVAATAPVLEFDMEFSAAGEFPLVAYLLPTHPLTPGRGLRFAVGLDDQLPQIVECERRDGSPEWAQGVLNNIVTVSAALHVPTPGAHALKIYGVDAGVVLDKLVIDLGGLQPSYLGPADTRVLKNR